MNSLKFLPHTLILTLLLSASFARADGETCPEYYGTLANWGKNFIVTRFDPKKPMPHGPIERAREAIKNALMNFKGRKYPILAMEDATALKANLLAKNALKDTAGLDGAPFKLAELKKEVEELLKEAEAYPVRHISYLQDTATFAAQAEAMRDGLKAAEAAAHDIKAMMPVATLMSDGTLKMEMKPRVWGNFLGYKQELYAAEQEVKKRIPDTTLEATTSPEAFTFEQAKNLKKLENYIQELRYQRLKLGERGPIPELDLELKPIYDRIEALYNKDSSFFKPEFSPPAFAWNKLKWEQLKAELKTVWQKDRIALTDNETTKKVVAYLQDLSPEELRLLGVDKIAASITVLNKNVYVRSLVMGVLGTGGATTGIGYAISFAKDLLAEAAKSEACADSTNDDKFRECAFDVVQSKFPVKTIQSLLFNKDTFLDDTGSIKDPKVRAVVEDLVQRHATYAGTEKQKSENQEAFLKQIKEFQAVKDPGSDAFREKVIMAPRKELFILGLTGIENSATAYLDAQHPGQFRKNRKLVENLLTEDDTDKQDQLMNQLRLTGACELAETLDDLLSDRADFLKGRFTPGDRRRRRRSSCGDGGSNFGSGFSNGFGNGFGNNSGGFKKPKKPSTTKPGTTDDDDNTDDKTIGPKINRINPIDRDDTN